MGKKREEKRRKRKREIIKKAVFDKRAEKIWWVDGWERSWFVELLSTVQKQYRICCKFQAVFGCCVLGIEDPCDSS